MHISSLRQPGYPPLQNVSADPWLCVTRLLRLCPFGERYFIAYIQLEKPSTKSLRENQHFFSNELHIFTFQLTQENFLTIFIKKKRPHMSCRRSVFIMTYSDQITGEDAKERYDSDGTIKKEHRHLPKMGVLLLSVPYRMPGCISHLFGNPAIRLCIMLRRTRGFASPDCSGFARSENVVLFTTSNANVFTKPTAE
jgi:hypothetical protein